MNRKTYSLILNVYYAGDSIYIMRIPWRYVLVHYDRYVFICTTEMASAPGHLSTPVCSWPWKPLCR